MIISFCFLARSADWQANGACSRAQHCPEVVGFLLGTAVAGKSQRRNCTRLFSACRQRRPSLSV